MVRVAQIGPRPRSDTSSLDSKKANELVAERSEHGETLFPAGYLSWRVGRWLLDGPCNDQVRVICYGDSFPKSDIIITVPVVCRVGCFFKNHLNEF